MDVKYANTIYVRNLCHVVLTTNTPLGMFIPEEDRRLFVMASSVRRGDLGTDYFDRLYGWLNAGGAHAAVRWLLARDLRQFTPTAPPPATAGRSAIV